MRPLWLTSILMISSLGAQASPPPPSSWSRSAGDMPVHAGLDSPGNPGLSLDLNGKVRFIKLAYPRSASDFPWEIQEDGQLDGQPERPFLPLTSRTEISQDIRDVKGKPSGITGTLKSIVEYKGFKPIVKNGKYCLHLDMEVTLSVSTDFEADLDAVYPKAGFGKVALGSTPVTLSHHVDLPVPVEIASRQQIGEKQFFDRVGFFFGGEIRQNSPQRTFRFTQLLKDPADRLCLLDLDDHQLSTVPCPLIRNARLIAQKNYGGTAYRDLPKVLSDLFENGGMPSSQEGSVRTARCWFAEEDPGNPTLLTLIQAEVQCTGDVVTALYFSRTGFTVGEDFRALLEKAQQPK